MIYVECKPDEVLVRTLTQLPRREIIHEWGKFEVIKKVIRQTNCTCMIDEDPNSVQPKYLEHLTPEELPDFGLRLLRDAQRNNRIVVLRPRLLELIRTATISLVILEDCTIK